jgi:hypothetical protein
MKVATKARPLALQVCTLKPMTLKQYHRTSSIALNLRDLSFISTCKLTKIIGKEKEEES